MSDRSRPLSARAAVMSESFSPAELLDAEWPSHLLGEILDNLLEGDLTAKEEALAQRRLAKGAREDEDGENARTVLSACLRFAGKKLHGGDGGPAHHHKTASAQASNWCACALAVTRDAPPTASISSAAYDTFRGAFMRHENLGDVMLATTTRAAEKDGGSRRVSAFVALAAASSRTVRDAVDALAGCVSAMPIDDVDAFVDGLDERAAIDLLECAIAREDQTLATKTLPCLFRSKRECAAAAMRLASRGLTHDDGASFTRWSETLAIISESCAGWSLGEDDEAAVLDLVRKLPSLAKGKPPRATSRVVRALTRVVHVSSSSSCREALNATARACLDESGTTAACGLSIASELLRMEKDVSVAVGAFDSGFEHGDEFVTCVAHDLASEVVANATKKTEITRWKRGVLSRAASIANEAVEKLANAEDGDASAFAKRLPAVARLHLAETRTTADAAVAFTRDVLQLIDGLVKGTRDGLKQNRTCCSALRSVVEIMLDESVRFPSSAEKCLETVSKSNEEKTTPSDLKSYRAFLLDAHRAMQSVASASADFKLNDASTATACRVTLSGAAKLLDLKAEELASEHRAHVFETAASCVRESTSPSNFHAEEDNASENVVTCATHAMTAWRDWRSSRVASAQTPTALQLLSACVSIATAAGDVNSAHSLASRVTNEQERVAAAQAVAKRAQPAMASNSFTAAGRAGRHFPACGVAAMFSLALHDLVSTSGLGGVNVDIARGMLRVTRTLMRASGSEHSRDAAFVVDSSMSLLRDAMFYDHVMKAPSLATDATEIIVDHYQRVDTASDRVSSLADILFDASPHLGKGKLLDACTVLVSTIERDLIALAKTYSLASHLDAISDASVALQKTLDAALKFTKAKSDAADAKKGMPGFLVLAVKTARLCLDAVYAQPQDSDELVEVISAGARLQKSIELLMRHSVLPSHVMEILRPWRAELFFESARMTERLSLDKHGRPTESVKGLDSFVDKGKGGAYLEEVMHTRDELAARMSWADEWVVGGGAAVEQGGVKSATAHADGAVNGTKNAKKRRRRKRDRNPYVEALKEAEGKRGGTSREYDDLEDFIVCKPGKNYRRLLGL